MTTYEHILVERLGTDDRLARITLNRPDRLNALSPDLLAEFEQALKELEDDPTARVIIIRGAGRAFSAGYDLATPRRQTEYRAATQGERRSVWRIRTNMVRVSDLYLYFWNMAKVTIAQVHGYCIAGGCELAMMADLVIAAEDATFGHPGTRGLGTSRTAVLWPLLIGMRKAKELLYTGDSISGAEAERIGMINKAVPAAELEETVLRWAERIANQAADSLALQKRSVNTYFEQIIYPAIHSATPVVRVIPPAGIRPSRSSTRPSIPPPTPTPCTSSPTRATSGRRRCARRWPPAAPASRRRWSGATPRTAITGPPGSSRQRRAHAASPPSG